MATVALSVPHSNSEHIAAAVRKERRGVHVQDCCEYGALCLSVLRACFLRAICPTRHYALFRCTIDGSPGCRESAALVERHGVGCHSSVFPWGYPLQPAGDASRRRCARAAGSECQSLGIRKRCRIDSSSGRQTG